MEVGAEGDVLVERQERRLGLGRGGHDGAECDEHEEAEVSCLVDIHIGDGHYGYYESPLQ